MQPVSVDHYENFPVASILCPPAIRPAVIAIYGFARTADDLADEGDASAEHRLSDLADFRRDLDATAEHQAPSPRWSSVFSALSAQLHTRQLPLPLLHDLLSAFEQDVVKNRYADRAELLDYCRRSANPVGRLLLHLYGVNDARSLAQSDAICSALQLINFWQDLSVDTPRGRLYVPLSDCKKHGVDPAHMMAREDNAATRALVADMVAWARTLMMQGAPLVHAVPGRAGWELRLVVQGGLRIAEKITRLQHASLITRPTLRWFDVPVLLWRAWCMKPLAETSARKAA
jgi:hydroxysqualene synthase